MDEREKTACGCGHDHSQDDCGCGHAHHEHVHKANCGCGQHHQVRTKSVELQDSTPEEKNFLLILAQYTYLPVTRFLLTNSAEAELVSIALAPVVIDSLADTMETVKKNGQALLSLEERGLITLDYDIPLDGYDYEGYRDSDLYRYFAHTVEESKGKPGFLFDTATLETGSMALTDAGRELMLEE